jgi:hypothetical protein
MKSFKSVEVLGVSLLLLSLDVIAGNEAENFSAIARMNVFRLNPPQPVAKMERIQPELPRVSLGGLATLLGSQALLTIQTKTSPATMEVSCVLGEGESRDGVTVLKIDMESGTVLLTNQGEQQVLMIKPR